MKKVSHVLKDYFIPHDGNSKKPHVLRAQAIAFVCMVALVAESAFVFGVRYIIPQSKLYGIIEVNALTDETNQSRTANNLPALQVDPLLQAAAQQKADDMASKGYFAHTSPQGLTPWYWFENVGYNFSYAGENLAVNFSDSQDVTNAWMNSPEHRANILSGDFTQIGIATAQGVYNGQSVIFVVEEFGTPAAAPVAFVNSASNQSTPTTEPIPQVVAVARTPAVAPAPTPSPAITPTPTPAPTPSPVVAVKPKPKSTPTPKPVAVVPTIVAMNVTTTASATNPTFVAVKGADVTPAQTQTQTQTVLSSATTTPVATSVAPIASTNDVAPVPQGNFMQKLFSNPKALADDFYLVLIVLFALALVLNVFIDIRTQFPRLIAGGLLVIVIAGLCIMLNQNIALFHATVL